MSEVREISSRGRFLWDAAHVVPGTAVSRIIVCSLLESAEMNESSALLLPGSVASQCCAVCGNLLTASSSTLRWAGKGRSRRGQHRPAARRGFVKCNVCTTTHYFPLKRTARQQPQTPPLPTTPGKVASTPRQAASSPRHAASTPRHAASTPRQAASTPRQGASTPPQAASTPRQGASTPRQGASTPNRTPTHVPCDLLPLTPQKTRDVPLVKSNSSRKKKSQRNNLKKALERQRSTSEPTISPDLKSFLELLSSQ